MAVPASREQFKEWCLRQLGFPVIEINVDDDQVEDRIDEALQFFQDFHFDATEKTYLKHQITASDLTNQYISVPEGILGITRIFPYRGANMSSTNMFDPIYQLRLSDMYNFSAVSTSYTNYVITQQHIRMVDMLFNGEVPIRFNRHTDKLYVDWNWVNGVAQEGEYIIIECTVIVDPDAYTDVWNDRMLKKYATALIKKQWGSNMKKFEGMQLPGGVTMNGQKIHDEAVIEIQEVEDYIRDTYQEPPNFLVG